MIVFNFKGGLGNQMFQFAFMYSLIKKGFDVKINLEDKLFKIDKIIDYEFVYINTKDKKKFGIHHNIFVRILNEFYSKYFPKKYISYKPKVEIFNDFDFSYEKLSQEKNVFLDGYWQSEEYFKDYNSEIKQYFLNEFCSKRYDYIEREILESESIGIHWRRGDYVNHETFEVVNERYFNKAIKHVLELKNVNRIFIFSDDIDYVKSIFFNSKYSDINIYVSSSKIELSDYEELMLLSKCSNLVLSNSSFSWWSAYLNQNTNKIVVIPSKWSLNNKIDVNKIALDKWVRIDA